LGIVPEVVKSWYVADSAKPSLLAEMVFSAVGQRCPAVATLTSVRERIWVPLVKYPTAHRSVTANPPGEMIRSRLPPKCSG
jgi:hypothetical protein